MNLRRTFRYDGCSRNRSSRVSVQSECGSLRSILSRRARPLVFQYSPQEHQSRLAFRLEQAISHADPLTAVAMSIRSEDRSYVIQGLPECLAMSSYVQIHRPTGPDLKSGKPSQAKPGTRQKARSIGQGGPSPQTEPKNVEPNLHGQTVEPAPDVIVRKLPSTPMGRGRGQIIRRKGPGPNSERWPVWYMIRVTQDQQG